MGTALSRRKRLAFKLAIIVLAYTCLELASAVLLTFFCGGIGTVWAERDKTTLMDETHVGPQMRPDVLHPYIGFVRQPTPPGSDAGAGGQHVTEFGFSDEGPPLHKRSADKLIVGILGGSVAEQFATEGTEELARELVKSPKFAGRKIVFVRMALQGYKQPQQLMTAGYLMTLGAEFDMLINLDGCNEIALPIGENVPNNVFPSFPRSWHMKIARFGNPVLLKLIGHITYLRTQQRRQAAAFATPPFRYSLTLGLLWKVLHESKDRAIIEDHQRIDLLARKDISYCTAGPRFAFTDERELWRHCVAVWSQSSLLLHQLCTANGIDYYHFLQPNQYVPGSKPIGARERMLAFSTKCRYRKPLVDCYPLLIREGKSLRAQGVRFHDLTQVFADHPEPLYVDSYCHFSREGNLILAREIGRLIRSEQETRGTR